MHPSIATQLTIRELCPAPASLSGQLLRNVQSPPASPQKSSYSPLHLPPTAGLRMFRGDRTLAVIASTGSRQRFGELCCSSFISFVLMEKWGHSIDWWPHRAQKSSPLSGTQSSVLRPDCPHPSRPLHPHPLLVWRPCPAPTCTPADTSYRRQAGQ